MNKVLQPYKDWLLFNRGEIKPQIKDKVLVSRNDSWCEREIKEIFEEINIQLKFSEYSTDWEYLTKCYVEIDYNPKPN